MDPAASADAPLADTAQVRRAMEYYASRGWTDGLPVVPVTESYLAEFLATTSRGPQDVVFSMPHLNRQCTVRLAALVMVAGANNAGVSAVIETFGPRGGPPAVVRVEEPAATGSDRSPAKEQA